MLRRSFDSRGGGSDSDAAGVFHESKHEELPSVAQAGRFLRDSYSPLRHEMKLDDVLSHVPGSGVGPNAIKKALTQRWRECQTRVDALRRSRTRETDTVGRAFEDMVVIEVDRQNIFGGEVLPAATYDDYINHVDFTVELGDASGDSTESLKLLVDVTSSDSYATVLKKMSMTPDGGELEFFYSSSSDGVVKLEGRPRIIIGLGSRSIPELSIIGMEHSHTVEIPTYPGSIYKRKEKRIDDDAYSGHPMSLLFLEEARVQMKLLVAEKAVAAMKTLRSRNKRDMPSLMQRILETNSGGNPETNVRAIKFLMTSPQTSRRCEDLLRDDLYQLQDWIAVGSRIDAQYEAVAARFEANGSLEDAREYVDRSVLLRYIGRVIDERYATLSAEIREFEN